MRLRFSDITKLKRIAKREVQEGLGKLINWWSQKYKLPPNHPLFLERTIGSLNIEMYSDLYIKKDDLEQSLKDSTGKEMDAIVKQLNEINTILDEEQTTVDPLVDKWERELAEGKTPDLDENLNA